MWTAQEFEFYVQDGWWIGVMVVEEQGYYRENVCLMKLENVMRWYLKGDFF